VRTTPESRSPLEVDLKTGAHRSTFKGGRVKVTVLKLTPKRVYKKGFYRESFKNSNARIRLNFFKNWYYYARWYFLFGDRFENHVFGHFVSAIGSKSLY
jgi:hypothetical protein